MQTLQKKSASRRTLDNILRDSSTIAENTKITGSFSGGENIVVRGHVIGDSDINGIVVIAHTGCWDGKLVADSVIVAGTVNGDIKARDKIELLSGSKILGNLSCSLIAIETGAIHDGQMDMETANEVKHFEEKRANPTSI